MKNNFFSFLIMHIGFLVYSFYSLIGKFSSKYEFLSFNFILNYCILIFILFIYAIIWQQVLKNFDLSFATANKSITVIWGMLWSYIFFAEHITLKKIIAIILIISGIILYSYSSNKEKEG